MTTWRRTSVSSTRSREPPRRTLIDTFVDRNDEYWVRSRYFFESARIAVCRPVAVSSSSTFRTLSTRTLSARAAATRKRSCATLAVTFTSPIPTRGALSARATTCVLYRRPCTTFRVGFHCGLQRYGRGSACTSARYRSDRRDNSTARHDQQRGQSRGAYARPIS